MNRGFRYKEYLEPLPINGNIPASTRSYARRHTNQPDVEPAAIPDLQEQDLRRLQTPSPQCCDDENYIECDDQFPLEQLAAEQNLRPMQGGESSDHSISSHTTSNSSLHAEDFPVEVCDDENQNTRLQNLLQEEGFMDIIRIPVDKSKGDVLLMILKYALRHSLSQTAVADLIKLVNCIFARSILPDTRYLIDNIFNPSNGVKFHGICTLCHTYLGEYDRSVHSKICRTCATDNRMHDSDYKDFFITLDTSSAIATLLESHWEYYNFITNERVHEKGIIRDIYDGKQYRKFVKSLNGPDQHNYATVTFNSDGSPLFESSAYSIWPIQLMINELPIHERTQNLIICSLWFGKSKPDMNVFLESFVENMNVLSTNGVRCRIERVDRFVKVYPICCCVDSVARAPMQGLRQFNAYYGCNWCLHPGEWIETSVKYPIRDEIPPARNANDTIAHMRQSMRQTESVYGVKGPSQLINLLYFNIIIGFVVDYMHCVLLGVAKQLAEYWCSHCTAPYYLTRHDVELIDKALKSIKSPKQIERLSRPFSDRTHWKAREWENWILYYSIPCLRSVLGKKYLLHWSNLVEALHMLLKSNITIQELDYADRLLHQFAFDMQSYYGERSMTYNVHQLLHLAKTVQDWGPLWAHSGFAFESGNGGILKLIQAAKGVPHQICRRIGLKQSMFVLKMSTALQRHPSVTMFCDLLTIRTTQKSQKVSEQIRYFGVPCQTAPRWIEELQLTVAHTVSYKRMVKERCVYSSVLKTNKRSNNNCALLKNSQFVQLIEFILDNQSGMEYTIVKIMHTTTCDSNYVNRYLHKVSHIDVSAQAVRTCDIDKVPNLLFY